MAFNMHDGCVLACVRVCVIISLTIQFNMYLSLTCLSPMLFFFCISVQILIISTATREVGGAIHFVNVAFLITWLTLAQFPYAHFSLL